MEYTFILECQLFWFIYFLKTNDNIIISLKTPRRIKFNDIEPIFKLFQDFRMTFLKWMWVGLVLKFCDSESKKKLCRFFWDRTLGNMAHIFFFHFYTKCLFVFVIFILQQSTTRHENAHKSYMRIIKKNNETAP